MLLDAPFAAVIQIVVYAGAIMVLFLFVVMLLNAPHEDTEYSSMSFAMFFLAEYINMVTVSAVATDLFLGGWHGPFLPESLGWIWFLLKVSAILFFYVWMRWTLPRYRYDQLMAFGWKVLLPLAVVNLLVTAAAVLHFGM